MASLRFILGRAGSGKTHTCREEIARALREAPDGHPLIFLAPEQSTFQIERELATAPGLGGFARVQVMSFRRLAARVLEECGGAARPRLTEVGRLMALRALLHRHEEDLRLFAPSARRRGFVEQVARTLTELRAYAISPPQLEDTRRRLERAGGPAVLVAKLQDLATVARAYDRYLEGRFLDPDDTLALCARRLGESALVREAEVWVDGFAGFTPQEYLVLEAMFPCARRLHVSLCLDPATAGMPPDDTDLFFPTRDTYGRLCSRALAAGVSLEHPLPLPLGAGPPRFAPAPSLAFLERRFEDHAAEAFTGRPEAIRLVEAADPRAEVETAAREIVRLAREEGYRWRDVAVLFRDLEPYRDLVTALDVHGIPYFLDERRPGLHHPLVELVRSALESLVTGWAPEPLFRYLKTDLVPVGRDEVDRLENHVLARGVRGGGWTGDPPWPEDLEDSRRRAGAALLELTDRAGRKGLTVRDRVAALRLLLDRLEVAARLQEWEREALAAGRPAEAQEHAQVWTEVSGLLAEMESALGEECLEADVLADVMETGLATLRLGLVPPALDQVLVGQVDRSRLPEVRAAFVLGVAEGTFPRPPQEDQVFDDAERDLLLKHGLELAPTSRERLLREGYLGYIALTRPSERLWVSYPRGAEDGKAVFPSILVRRVRDLFPQLQPAEEDPLAHLAGDEIALARLALELRRAREGAPLTPFWSSFHRWFSEQPGGPGKLRAALAGLAHSNRGDALPRELVRELYGDPLRASVSRLERFAACPYAHFLGYGLRLEQRRRYRLEPEDVGTLLHDALRDFVREMTRRGLDWGPEASADRERLAGEILERLAPGVQHAILLSSSRFSYVRRALDQALRRAVAMLARHARRSGFRPLAVEVGFGPGHDLPALEEELAGGLRLELRGRIDRVDRADGEEGPYLRVIDYKSSRRRLLPAGVAAGMDLQLLCYLAVVLENAGRLGAGLEGAAGAGAFYLPLLARPVRADGPLAPAEAERRWLEQFRLDGLAVSDPDVITLLDRGEEDSPAGHLVRVRLRKDGSPWTGAACVAAADLPRLLRAVRGRLVQLGNRLAAGEVGLHPYRHRKERACRFCEFRPACGFEPLVGDGYRDAGAGATWENLAGEGPA